MSGLQFISQQDINENQQRQSCEEMAWRVLMPSVSNYGGGVVVPGDTERQRGERARKTINKQIERVRGELERSLPLCESPIERLMLIGMAYMPLPQNPELFPSIFDVVHDPLMPVKGVVIAPQFQLGRYRLDFYLQWNWCANTGNASRLCVECDGKEYHDYSQKDHYTRDKIRDGFIASFGCETDRYSGAQIYKSGPECADMIRMRIVGTRAFHSLSEAA